MKPYTRVPPPGERGHYGYHLWVWFNRRFRQPKHFSVRLYENDAGSTGGEGARATLAAGGRGKRWGSLFRLPHDDHALDGVARR